MSTTAPIDIDIISDVMCPWCIVGFRQLEQALAATGMGAHIRWHPFELNPDMPPEGEDTTAHIMRKYGRSRDEAASARTHLIDLGAPLGISFNKTSRMWNTFKAHQLLDFALSQGKQHPLKLALFDAHFTQGRNVSDSDVLVDVATEVGLDPRVARQALEEETFAASVRDKQALWQREGISGVPSMIFKGQFLVTGAQGAENYARLLTRLTDSAA